MGERVIVSNKGGAIEASAGFNLKLPEDMQVDQYTKFLEIAREKLSVARDALNKGTSIAVPKLYEVGQALLGLEKRIPTFSDHSIGQIVCDLESTPKPRPATMKMLRTFMKIAKMYTKPERVEQLANSGITDSHFTLLAQVDDGRTRRALEDKTIEQSLSVKELQKEVGALMTTKTADGKPVLSQSSQKRRKQAATVKGNKREKRIGVPSKQFDYMLSKIQQILDDVGDTFMAIKGIESTDAADRPALLPGLNSLVEKFGNLGQTVQAIMTEAKKGVALCKAADKA